MSKKLRIVVINPPDEVPDFFRDTDGFFTLDLTTEVTIAITKQIDEFSQPGKLKQDTVRNIVLPSTKKNNALIGNRGNPLAFNFNHRQPVEVRIIYSDYVLPETFLKLRTTGDSGFMEVEISGQNSNWVKPLSELKINELDFGSAVIDGPLIEGSWTRHAWQDTDDPFFFPLVNYGIWNQVNIVSPADFRAWFSPLFILREAFCRIGWNFVCDFLQTDYGRRLWIYILSEDYLNAGVLPTEREFQAEKTDSVPVGNIPFPVTFQDDFTPPNFDTSGNYNPALSQYSGAMEGDFFAVLNYSHSVSGTLRVGFVLTTPNGNFTLSQQEVTVSGAGSGTISISVTNVTVNPPAGINVVAENANGPALNFSIDPGSRFYNKAKTAIYQPGDTVIFANQIDENLVAIELLKGIVHLFNLKVETDPIKREVRFFPSQSSEVYFEGLQEGFFFPDSGEEEFDLTKKVEQGSLNIEFNELDVNENYLLRFKDDSSDANVQKLGFQYPLHSKNVDFGEDFPSGTLENENPFFAPTFNDFDLTIGQDDGPGNGNTRPYIPFIWDREKGEDGSYPPQSTKIVPRICLAWIDSFMIFDPVNFPDVEVFTRGGFRWTESTSLFQPNYAPFGQIFPEGVEYDTIISRDFFEEAVVYGSDEYNTNIEDGYSLFYEEDVRLLYFGVPVNFLIDLTLEDFSRFSFRNKYFVRYRSERFGSIEFFARVSIITDFIVNRRLTTPVTLLPDVRNFKICD